MFDVEAIVVTLKLACLTVMLLTLIGLPLAWWLANNRSAFKVLIEAVTALPLVLPPTVLGFYLLLLLGSKGALGQAWQSLTGQPLAFTFSGLLLASCLYSLPFVVQPLQAAFEKLDRNALEASWTLGASRPRAFFTVVVPQIRRGLITAVVLGFAHTVGEFGVVLMVGGNIAGVTKVISISIYEQVEMLEYGKAHAMAALLLVFSFIVLFMVYAVNRRWQVGVRA